MEFENFLKNMGLQMKFARMKKNMTQANLAEILSTHENNLSKIETGKKNISMKTLYKIATALEIEPQKLLDFKD